MISFQSAGNVIDFLFGGTVNWGMTFSTSFTTSDLEQSSHGFASFFYAGGPTSFSIYTEQSVRGTALDGSNNPVPFTLYGMSSTSFKQAGEKSSQTVSTTNGLFGGQTTTETPSTINHSFIDEMTTTRQVSVYTINTQLSSFTYPSVYNGTYYTTSSTKTTINDEVTSTYIIISTVGVTTTHHSKTYTVNISTFETAEQEYTFSSSTLRTRIRDAGSSGGTVGSYFSTNNIYEMLIVLIATSLNKDVTEAFLTDLSYETASLTTLFYEVFPGVSVDAGAKGLFSIGSNLILSTPDAHQVIADVPDTLYTERNTSFSLNEGTYTYFSEIDFFPLAEDTDTYESITGSTTIPRTSFVNNGLSVYNGWSPLVLERVLSITSKSTNIWGLGTFPFSIALTDSRNGIKEYLTVQTAPGEINVTTSTTILFDSNQTNKFYPDFVFTTATTDFSRQHAFSYNFAREVSVDFARSIRISAQTAGPTLYSNFIVPGIKIFNDTGSDIYQNITLQGGSTLYELNNVTEFRTTYSDFVNSTTLYNDSYFQLLMLSSFTKLRSFLDDESNINYIKWLDSENIGVTLLSSDTSESTIYTVSYGPKIDVSHFYVTKTLRNNAQVWINITHQFGGPNYYSKPEYILGPKGKYDVTRYNLLLNTSSSSQFTLEQFGTISCDTSEYVKFIFLPYITLETDGAPLKNQMSSTVMPAMDLEE